MMKKFNDVIVVGFALFAMFFGAGNLIFPPTLGIGAGTDWVPGVIGFILTGVGIPLLGIIATSKAGGELRDLGNKVNPTFSIIFGSVALLALGPLLAVPRTGATTFEIGVQPLFPSVSPILVSAIYFSISLYLALTPSSIIDKIGKVLTPTLLVALSIIIFKGIMNPIGTPIETGAQNSFSVGFKEGYQTMDAFCSMAFCGIVISALVQKGYTKTKDQLKLTMMAGVVAAVGLGIIYGGLMYLGATASNVYPADMSRANLVLAIVEHLLGTSGKAIVAIAVSLACLTTSVGITATCGEFFSKLSNEKLSYKAVCIIVTIFSAVVSCFGIANIVKLAVPLLTIAYPVAMVLIIMNLFDDFIPNKSAYTGAVSGAFCISLFDALASMGIQIESVSKMISKLPLAEAGFAWVVPAVVGAIIGIVLKKKEDVPTQAYSN